MIADPVRDKEYVEIVIDEPSLRSAPVEASDVRWIAESLVRPPSIGEYSGWKRSIPVRLSVDAREVEDGDPMSLQVAVDSSQDRTTRHLGEFARVAHRDGPATIKSENGLIRNYVRFNVRDRATEEVVRELSRTLEQQSSLPSEVSIEWCGQFEYAANMRQTMLAIVPLVIVAMLALMYMVFGNWTDACLMFIPVPFAVSGGALSFNGSWAIPFPSPCLLAIFPVLEWRRQRV